MLERVLRKALAIDEFVISETHSRSATQSIGGKAIHQAQNHELLATIYVDRKRGRGEALLTPQSDVGLPAQVKKASTRAFGALGKAWRLPAPAASAQVAVRDASMQSTPRETAKHAMGGFVKACPANLRILTAQLTVQYRTCRALVSNGFDNRFPSTEITLDAMVQAKGGSPVPVYLRGRRSADLKLTAALDGAHRRSRDHAQSRPVVAGLVDVVLLASSYVPRGDGDFGVWTPLVAQATASLLRDGLSAHVPNQSLLSQPTNGDLLTMTSMGTIPYGLRSAPFSKDGQATRNFSVARDGKATGVSVNYRDSALGAGPPNGGIRGLLVAAGEQSAQELRRPEGRPLLIAQHLGPMRFAGQGRVYMEIESGSLLRRDALGVVQETPTHSAVLCANLYDWLADAYYSRETSDESWFQGPQTIRLNRVRIH